jgi:hypothetical protein
LVGGCCITRESRSVVANLLTSCDNAVPVTSQQGWLLNRLIASLLTSCDNAVPTTSQQGVFAIGL